jgi:hypothetical protein
MPFFPLFRKNFKESLVSPFVMLALLIGASIVTALLFPVFHRSHTTSPFKPSVVELWTLSFLALSLFSIFLITGILLLLTLLQSKHYRKTLLTPYGPVRLDKAKVVEIKWSTIFWIIRWSDDVLFCTFADATFIPREAFKSTQEAQEFVQIARELHTSRGASWRDEWNGKIFGRMTQTSDSGFEE